jgi:hypothetical protein
MRPEDPLGNRTESARFQHAAYDACPDFGQSNLGIMVTPAEVVAVGLILLLLMIGATIAVVAVSTVLAKTRGRQDTGVRVLAELRRIIRDVLHAVSLR